MTDKKAYIQIDDKMVVMADDGKGGLKARYLTDDETFEVSVLEPDMDKALDNEFNHISQQAYSELVQEFKTSVKKTLLQSIGFDHDWNKWRVDHCNGRMSLVTELLSPKIRALVTAEFDNMLQPEMQKIVNEVKKAVIDDFKSEFHRAARQEASRLAFDSAKKFVNELFDKKMKREQKKMLQKVQVGFFGKKVDSVKKSDEDKSLDDDNP